MKSKTYVNARGELVHPRISNDGTVERTIRFFEDLPVLANFIFFGLIIMQLACSIGVYKSLTTGVHRENLAVLALLMIVMLMIKGVILVFGKVLKEKIY